MGELSRRAALGLGVSALGAAALRAQGAPEPAAFCLRFRTSPERLARLLPPPLQATDQAVVHVEWRRPAGSGDALAARAFVAARLGDREGWFPVLWRTDSDRLRTAAREGARLPALDGEPTLRATGDIVEAGLRRGEREVCRARAKVGAQAAAPPRVELLFAPDYRLSEDWTEEVIAGDQVVWRALDQPSTSEWRSCGDISFDWVERSPAEPATELPVEGIAGAWASFEKQPAPEFLPGAVAAEIAAGEFARSSFSRYERPGGEEGVWRPEGWPDSASALALTPAELERWSGRKELILRPVEIVELEAMIDPDVHEALLPRPCRGAGRPAIRVLGLRAHGGDLSTQPFDEVWLFAFSVVEGRAAWYALSHVVSAGGDVVYGRETFGYPSRRGSPEVVATPVDFSLSGFRQGREFVFADGGFQGFATGVSLAQLPVVSLRADPDGRGRLVFQMWTYQGRRNRVDPGALRLIFPRPEDGQPRTDPWFELEPMQLTAVSVMDGAVMQRTPGEVVAETPAFEPYYLERGDGALPWEPLRDGIAPSFLAERTARRRSS